MSYNRAQSRVVTNLLTGHNTLRRPLHIMGLVDSPVCRKCGAGEETSAHVLCECEAVATRRHIYLGSFFLDPETVRGLSLWATWNFFRRTGLLRLGSNEGAQRACEGVRARGTWGLDPHLLILPKSIMMYLRGQRLKFVDIFRLCWKSEKNNKHFTRTWVPMHIYVTGV
jgi:hypothetical protein